jgi:hypothetical protein
MISQASVNRSLQIASGPASGPMRAATSYLSLTYPRRRLEAPMYLPRGLGSASEAHCPARLVRAGPFLLLWQERRENRFCKPFVNGRFAGQ